MTVGTRAQVWHGTKTHTSGGLTKGDLFQDKYGNIKSKKASKQAKGNQNLRKAGWGVQKGKFGAVRLDGSPRRSRRSRSPRRSRRSRSPRRSRRSRR
jgi:hypothetical protein